jgi:F420H(2)-dependent quinone reductase
VTDRQAPHPPLAHVRDGERYVLCASNGATPAGTTTWRPPAGPRSGSASSTFQRRTADPSEHRRLFSRFVETYKGYDAYEDKTSPQIPLVLLTPDRPNPNDLKPSRAATAAV